MVFFDEKSGIAMGRAALSTTGTSWGASRRPFQRITAAKVGLLSGYHLWAREADLAVARGSINAKLYLEV